MTGALVMGAHALTLNGSLGTWAVNSAGNEMSFTRSGANYIDAPGSSGNIVFRTGTSYNTALTIASNQMAHFEGNIYAANSIYVGDDVRISSDGNGELGVGYGQTATNNRFTVYNNTAVGLQVKPNGNVNIPNGELNVGIAAGTNSSKLRVHGKIVAGDVGSTTGDVLLEGYYGNGATVVIGAERSSGGVFLGYGVQPSVTTQHQFLSSTVATLTQGAYVAADTHRWWTASSGSSVAVGSQVTTMTQRMSILANGTVIMGSGTAGASDNVTFDSGRMRLDKSGDWNIESGNSSSGAHIRFRQDSGDKGSITTSSAGTTFNTTSDRRLKDNIESIDDGKEKLLAMNPVNHTWIADPEAPAVHGFIAQEMQIIVPESVHGDPEGETMMSMDYGRITPVIVAALQDALREIEGLKTRINKLEAK
jgi:hypothetical protein